MSRGIKEDAENRRNVYWQVRQRRGWWLRKGCEGRKRRDGERNQSRNPSLARQKRTVCVMIQSKMRPALIMPLSSIKMEHCITHNIPRSKRENVGRLRGTRENKGCSWKHPAGANCNISSASRGKTRGTTTPLIKRREAFPDWTAGGRRETTRRVDVRKARRWEAETQERWNISAASAFQRHPNKSREIKRTSHDNPPGVKQTEVWSTLEYLILGV